MSTPGDKLSAGRGETDQSTSLAAFLASLSLASSLSIASFIFFWAFKRRFRSIYDPKPVRPVTKSVSYWRCMLAISSTFEDDLVQEVGGDAATFLRFLATLGRIFSVGCIIVTPILLSLNVYNGVVTTGMDRLNWGNIKPTNKERYWGHCTCSIFFVAFTLYAIDGELAQAMKIRQALLARPALCHIVLISDIPHEIRDKERIRIFYQQAIQNPQSVQNVFDVSRLSKMMSRRDAALRKYERVATSRLQRQLHGGQMSKDTKFLSRGFARLLRRNSAEDLDLQRTRLASYNEQIDKMQNERDKLPTKNAFLLTFRSSSTAIALERCSAFPRPDCMFARYIGTEASDLKWRNIGLRSMEFRWRRTISDSLTICLVLAWAIPIASTGVLSQAVALSQIIGSDRLDQIPPTVLGLLEGVLPQLALTALMCTFPFVLKMITAVHRSPSKVMDEEYCQSKYFLFLFFNQFLTVSVSSSAVAIVAAFLNRAESIPKVLAINVPKASNYFLSYIPLQSLYCSIGVCLQAPAFFNKLRGRLADKTAYEKYLRAVQVPTVQWSLVYPVYTNLACIVIIYAPIAPIILPLALCAFAIFWVCFRFSIISITDTDVESNGRLYPWALLQLYTGLYVGEACWLGLFILQIQKG